MANVHNLILRGLNSIYLQADKISDPADISDFVLYVKAWQDTVHHHHSTEETLFFPRVEKIAVEAGLPANIMSRNLEQHQEFDGALHALNDYVKDVIAKEKEYESKELVRLVEQLAPVLRQHLNDEIDTLVGLEKCDGKAIANAMKITAAEGAKTADPVSLTTQPFLRFCSSLHLPAVKLILTLSHRTSSCPSSSAASTRRTQEANPSHPSLSSYRT
jgi:hemerythrin-like domain-containing protein